MAAPSSPEASRRWRWPFEVILLLGSFLAIARGSSAKQQLGETLFVPPDNGGSASSSLTRFVYDAPSDAFFLGGVNSIYEVRRDDLSLLRSVRTGPKLDSPACHASGCSSDAHAESRELKNNTNKILLIDTENGKLVACGSLFQGACSTYPLRDISDKANTEFWPEPVAANDESASTFAFIGPQRYNRWGHGNVIYVGTTFTSAGDYRHDVPAISTRNLHNMKFAEYSFSKQSLLRIDVKYRDRFLVQYVYGFNTSDHIYFAIIQKRSHVAGQDDRGLVTRLARVCISDPNFDTYTEITIDCKSNGDSYDILTAAKYYAARTKNESLFVASFVSGEGGRSTAVCHFPITEVEKLFKENIHSCFNGSMAHRNLEYISGPVQEGKCPVVGSSGNIGDFCQVGLKLSGLFPISKEAVFISPDPVTALDYVREENNEILVLGTETGQIRAVKIGDVPQTVGAYWKHKKIVQLYTLGAQVYYLHKDGFGRVPIAQCYEHVDCFSCTNSGNPFCGWCPAENKCTRRSECETREQWMWDTRNKRCMTLKSVVPNQVDLFADSAQGEEVNLTIEALPELPFGGKQFFVCRYSDDIEYRARVTPTGLLCPNPAANLSRPRVEQLSAQEKITLTIAIASRESAEETVLLKTALTTFDCGRQESCGDCVRYPGCQWCLGESRCLSRAAGRSRCSSTSSSCPKLTILRDHIRVPNDEPTNLRLSFSSRLPAVLHSTPFYCLVDVEGAKMKLSAKLFNKSIVICDRTRFTYVAAVKEIPMRVSILAGQSEQALDSTVVYVYKCSHVGMRSALVKDCSLCLASPQRYTCGWCDDSCVFASKCRGNPTRSDAADACPNPQILSVSPMTGPLEGGTRITVEGSNLRLANPAYNILVGRGRCRRTEEGDAGLQCITPASSVARNVSVSLAPTPMRSSASKSKSLGAASAVVFQYKDFAVTGADPARGPRTGGGLLTVYGDNLDIGSAVEVFLDSVPCTVSRVVDSKSVECVVGAVRGARRTRSLSVRIDRSVREVDFSYEFRPEPVVRPGGLKPRKSFQSGGRTIAVHGEFFRGVPSPRLTVHLSDRAANSATCSVVSDTILECLTPQVPPDLALPSFLDASLQIATTRPAGFGSLVRDNSSSLSSFVIAAGQILYVSNPEYHNFTDGFKWYSEGDSLVIEGERLDDASSAEEVRVLVRDKECNVTALNKNQLICVPPAASLLRSEAGDYRSKYPVSVTIGRQLAYKLGDIDYDNLGAESDIPSEIIGGIGASAAILIFLAVVGLIILKHKSHEAERQYKRIQIQMDILENNVRTECKQAFAELQTDMTDMTMELEVTGIPIVSERAFLVNMFFPGVSNHPILAFKRDTQARRVTSPLSHLESLFFNKKFVVALVKALDGHGRFGIRDKINFGSLLSVVLLPRFDYFTDVLKTLIRHVVHEPASLRHPESLFRKTGSVVEKMLTNWLSVCLYDYTKDQVGPSLFVLYRAVKAQIEKGPVDMYSQEARYSLSENGLLRSNCDYYSITCLVLQRELEEAYETKVLSCDTISQVKRKVLDCVYKNTPFSLRPSLDEVDLEWQCGEEAYVILQDVDLTTVSASGGATVDGVSGVKRVNTLQHYGVKNKAIVSLVPRQYGTSKRPSNHHHGSEMGSVTGTSSSGSKVSSNGDEKLFHLDRDVREDDTNILGGSKAIPEIFLTRLLSTKGTLKKFIDDFFLSTMTMGNKCPCGIKWLFDLFDECGIDVDVRGSDFLSRAWKANSLFGQYWTSLVRNPDILYDVERTQAADQNLGIIGQVLTTSCTEYDVPISRDTPSYKLLFAKEIKEHNSQLNSFFDDVKNLPCVSDHDFHMYLTQVSQRYENLFNREAALNELHIYIAQYYDVILHELDKVCSPCDDVVIVLKNVLSNGTCQ